MAYQTDKSHAASADKPARSRADKRREKQGLSMLHIAPLATLTFLAGGWAFMASGALETIVPALTPVAPALRRAPAAPGFSFAVVDQNLLAVQAERRRLIAAKTSGSAYSNLDWKKQGDADDLIIADIGPDSVIVDLPVEMAAVIEPRADYVPKPPEPELVRKPAPLVASAPILQVLAYAPAKVAPVNQATLAFDKIAPLAKAEETDAVSDEHAAEVANAPNGADAAVQRTVDVDIDDVPLPGAKPLASRSRMAEGTKLAYAPDNGGTETRPFGPSPMLEQAARGGVAIYDISAGVVHMPNGERLEAHSGIGMMRDNPKFKHVKMRGPTPPSTYNLRMREALFHGIEAIRLLPADGRNPFGRDGLLAHTYMLRVPKDSNGCVVFKDYPRFLRAFKRGEVRKMVVVESMAGRSSTRFASLF